MDTLKIDLDRFASIVQELASIDLLATDALLLARDGKLSQYWAPFDHTPRSARLVIVGITPGRKQAANALHAFANALRSGQALEAALKHAKLVGSFSGPLRNNIVRMLDSVGVMIRWLPPAHLYLMSRMNRCISPRRFVTRCFWTALITTVIQTCCALLSCGKWWRPSWRRKRERCPVRFGSPSVQNRPLRYGASSRLVYFQRTASWKACRTRAALTPSASSFS